MALKPVRSFEVTEDLMLWDATKRVLWALGLKLGVVSKNAESNGVKLGTSYVAAARIDRVVPEFNRAHGIDGMLPYFREEAYIVDLVNAALPGKIAALLPKRATLDDPTAALASERRIADLEAQLAEALKTRDEAQAAAAEPAAKAATAEKKARSVMSALAGARTKSNK